MLHCTAILQKVQLTSIFMNNSIILFINSSIIFNLKFQSNILCNSLKGNILKNKYYTIYGRINNLHLVKVKTEKL